MTNLTIICTAYAFIALLLYRAVQPLFWPMGQRFWAEPEHKVKAGVSSALSASASLTRRGLGALVSWIMPPTITEPLMPMSLVEWPELDDSPGECAQTDEPANSCTTCMCMC